MENAMTEMTKLLSLLYDNLIYLEFSRNVQIKAYWVSEKTEQFLNENAKMEGLSAIESMLRHQKLLEVEVLNYSKEYEKLSNTGEKMVMEGNAMSNEIQNELLKLAKLGQDLDEKLYLRKKHLNLALTFEHFQLDCNVRS